MRRTPKKIKGRYCEVEQYPVGKFDKRSFRWTKGVRGWILIGCRKGQWDQDHNRCKTGTRAHKVLTKATPRHKCRGGKMVVK